jgi:nitrite reductase/ring-hydroxylating ferredoxin subunit
MDPGAREFELRIDSTPIAGFILHWQGQWYAYRNSCPHIGVALNWMPDRFFDLACEFIQCGLHGALFRPEDGLCIYGPCVGRSLERLPLVIDGAEIYIDRGSLSTA